MKLKVGNKLFWEREERKLSQIEMANLLGMSQSAYSRIERNEVSVDIEEITNFSKKLQVPLQEFLPETFAVHNSNHQSSQVGFVIGTFYSYGNAELAQENQHLKEKIQALESKIDSLEEIIALLKSNQKN